MKAKVLYTGSYHLPKENQVTQERKCVNSTRKCHTQNCTRNVLSFSTCGTWLIYCSHNFHNQLHEGDRGRDSWEEDGLSSCQEIPGLFWDPNKSPPVIPTLRQTNQLPFNTRNMWTHIRPWLAHSWNQSDLESISQHRLRWNSRSCFRALRTLLAI
jgi:hypothetical protein